MPTSPFMCTTVLFLLTNHTFSVTEHVKAVKRNCVLFSPFFHKCFCGQLMGGLMPIKRGQLYSCQLSDWLLDSCFTISTPVASPAMGHWGTCPPRCLTVSFLFHFGVNLSANCPSIVQSARSASVDVNNSQLFPSLLHSSQNYQSSSSCCTRP